MSLSEKQSHFLETFLGIRAPGASGESAKVSPMALWQEGKEQADQSITALQKVLKGNKIPALNQIAELGLNGLSGRNQTGLMKALFEYSRAEATSRETAARQLVDQVSAYRGMLQHDTVIALCENNPFGVAVDIRGPLLGALDRIEKAIV